MPRPRKFDEETTLKKAMCLFWRKGFHDTSMQDLVDELGINRASIYNTFGDKESLFKKSFALYLSDSQARVRGFLSSQANAFEGLHQLLKSGIQEASADTEHKGCFAVNVGTELAAEFDWAKEMVQRNQATMTEIFHQQLQRAVKQGEVEPTVDLAAYANLIFIFYSGSQVVARSGGAADHSLLAAESMLAPLAI